MPLGVSRQEDFSAGEQRDVSPHLIDPRGVYALENALLNDDGSLYKRGGSQSVSTAALGTHARAVWNGWLGPGRRTLMASTDRFGVLGEDGETLIDIGGAGLQNPKPMVAVQDVLFIGGGTMYGGSRKSADYLAGTASVTKGSATVNGSGTAWLANVDPGMLFRVGGGRVYVVATVATDTQLTLREAYEGETNGAAAYTLKRLESANAAPYVGAPIYVQAAQRLLACNGNVIDFSESKKPFLYQATVQTAGGPVTVQNRHEIEEGVTIITAATLGVDKALIFHTGGVTTISNLAASIVDANGNSQHRIDLLSADIVAWGAAGISSYRNALVVPALDDVYIMDGVSQPIPLSHSIDPLYQQYVLEGFVPGQTWVYRDHFFLPILDNGGDPIDLLVCRLDRPFSSRNRTLYPWTKLSGSGAKVAGAAVQPSASANDPYHVYGACDDGRMIELASFFTPEAANKHDHDGTTALFSMLSRDFAAGDLSIGRFRRFRLIYDLEVAEGETAIITLEVGTGIRKEEGARWDEVNWDEFLWAASDEETQFELLDGGAEPNAGPLSAYAQNAEDWWLRTHARYARFRLQSADAVAKLTVRTIEIFVAETGGVRQAKVIDRR
jgi:hypothetical protein